MLRVCPSMNGVVANNSNGMTPLATNALLLLVLLLANSNNDTATSHLPSLAGLADSSACAEEEGAAARGALEQRW